MTTWHASTELRLTATGLAAATVAKSVREAGKLEANRELGLGVDYRDTSG